MLFPLYFFFLVLQIATSKTIPLNGESVLAPRIIGGGNARAAQFPFAVAIDVRTPEVTFFCGGSLLNREWVLTSGFCVTGATLFTIRLGSTNLVNDDPVRVTVATSEYVLHPDYNNDTLENNIGLIKLREEIHFSVYIQPVYLPIFSVLNETSATAIGWGQTSDFDPEISSDLQYVDVSVIPNVECQLVYGTAVTDDMFCISGNYNEGPCIGDSGSPLVEYIGRYYMLMGVSTFISYNGCESTDPAGYTSVYPYVTWIKSFIE